MQPETLPDLRHDHRVDAVRGLGSAKGPVPIPWVRRERLHDRLDVATQRRITIISGPPGSGKTTLVAGWASSCDVHDVLWLSPVSGVAALVGTISDAASCPEHAGSERPTLVVIDDIDLIRDRSAAVALEKCAEQLPAHLRVVLIGRHMGSISAARLRLQTPVSELTGRDLEFTGEEADDLLSAFGVSLDSEALNVLIRETQGWAAGLRLAAILMCDTGDPQDVVRNLNVVGGPFWDYIEAEVIPQLRSGEIDALARASVTSPLHERFCEPLTGRSDALSLFESLSARNLFVTKSPGRYDLHPVFSRYLRHRLELAERDVMVEAHLKAAEFMREEGALRTAMHHYAKAKRWDKAIELGATELVQSLTDGSIPGEPGLLPGQVPDLYFAQDPARMYLLCAALIWASRLTEAQRYLARWKMSLDGSSASDVQRVRLEWLGALYDSATLDAEGVVAHFERAKELASNGLPVSGNAANPAWPVALDNAVLSQLPWIAARAHAVVGRLETATQILEIDASSRDLPLAALGLGPSAVVSLARGRLREAAELARRGKDVGSENAESPVLAVESRVVLAGVLFERDELDAARRELVEARRIAEEFGLDRWVALVDCDVARLCLAEGQPHRALVQVQAVRQAQIGCGLLDSRLDSLEFDCRLALHDIEGAQNVLEGMRPEHSTAGNIARLYLHAGRPDEAAAELGRASHPSRSTREQIDHLLLQARTNLFSGNVTSSDHFLQRAIETSRVERFIRVFLEQPAQLLDSLKRIYSRRHDDYVDEILTRFQSRMGVKPPVPVQIIEPLTERERELIAFLPSHLTQSEIGRRMYISANTVKTHMKGLYRKLGAQSRSEAVERAQVCGLL